MKDHGMIYRGIAHAQLESVFGAEYIKLDAHASKLIVQDYLDAAQDDNVTAQEYARRIGKGNLRSYADVMLVRERKGWDLDRT